MTHHNGGNVLLLFLLLTSVIYLQYNNDLCADKKMETTANLVGVFH